MNGTQADLQPQGIEVAINKVAPDRPWAWLAAGASDLRRASGTSLAYGGAWVLASFLVSASLYALDLAYWLLPMIAGFMFVGPVVAVGTYAISRSLERGETPSLGAAFGAWRANPAQLSLMGVGLMIFMIAWLRLAALLFALFFGLETPDPANLYSALLTTPEGLGMIAVGTAIGAVLTFGAFAVSVISLPLLLDRDISAVEAIVASLSCVAMNTRAMLLWAVILTVSILIGVLTFYIGLVMILPLLGHASWHAYRDLVRE
jgi:uncharacterized membrane protein